MLDQWAAANDPAPTEATTRLAAPAPSPAVHGAGSAAKHMAPARMMVSLLPWPTLI